jgi:hypothetical protein
MPFKSEAQRKFMWAKKKEGKLPGVNLHEWASKTHGKLPKRAKQRTKKASFEKCSGPIADMLRRLFSKSEPLRPVPPEKSKKKPEDETELEREAELKEAYARGVVARLTDLGLDPEQVLKSSGLI